MRKSSNFDLKELSGILDDGLRELSRRNNGRFDKFESLNELVRTLNRHRPSVLSQMVSHKFFVFTRNVARDFLKKLSKNFVLDPIEIYSLRNLIILFENLLENGDDSKKISDWLGESSFVNEFSKCLDSMEIILSTGENKRLIKQLTRLLNVFGSFQQNFTSNLHPTSFSRIFHATLDRLTSKNFHNLFRNLNPQAKSLSIVEKFYLVKCPFFLSHYKGPHIEEKLDETLKIMLPRYAHLLDQHIETIEQWTRPMMRAIHHLLNMMIFAEGFFTINLNEWELKSFIDNLLYLISEEKFIEQIDSKGQNLPSMLIDSSLIILTVLVYESETFDYLKQSRSIDIFRQLTLTPLNSIVLNSYMMLVYTMTEGDLEKFSDDLVRLFRTTIDLIYQSRRQETEFVSADQKQRNLLQLLEIFRGLVQHESMMNLLLQTKSLLFLVDFLLELHGLAREILLQSLWTISFHPTIAEILRSNVSFIEFLERLPRSKLERTASNYLRRSTSFSSRRTLPSVENVELNEDRQFFLADGILWNLIREKTRIKSKVSFHLSYDVMISYSFNDREIVKKLKEIVVASNYRVAFSETANFEMTMEQTANLIDRSAVLIVCLSDSYKRENHCRAEFQYGVSNENLSILPVIVRTGFEIDGWLKNSISKESIIDFSSQDVEESSSLVLKELAFNFDGDSSTIDDFTRRTEAISFDVLSTDTDSRYLSTEVSRDYSRNSFRQDLPEQYTKRDTSRSRYRSIPVKIWAANDVLDFFYDINLQSMMPICETMNGQGLIQFFRICQSRPSRVFSQISDELRRRFKGFTFPMGMYTQFLIEMDALLGPTASSVPKDLLNPPKIIDRFVPQTNVGSSQGNSTSNSKNPSKSTTPTTTPSSGAATPLIIERAVFRPASSFGRPYNFLVETIDEPAQVLRTVERYGPQLIQLDQFAQQIRQKNVSR